MKREPCESPQFHCDCDMENQQPTLLELRSSVHQLASSNTGLVPFLLSPQKRISHEESGTAGKKKGRNPKTKKKKKAANFIVMGKRQQ